LFKFVYEQVLQPYLFLSLESMRQNLEKFIPHQHSDGLSAKASGYHCYPGTYP